MRVLAIVGDKVAPAFSLAGMEVVSPMTHEELLQIFFHSISQKDIALLIISARFAIALKNEIEEVRLSKNPVIILEISSSRGNYHAGAKLMEYVKKVIG